MTEITHTETLSERAELALRGLERLPWVREFYTDGEIICRATKPPIQAAAEVIKELLAARQDQAAKTSDHVGDANDMIPPSPPGGEPAEVVRDPYRLGAPNSPEIPDSSTPGGEQEAVAWRARVATGGAWVYCDTRLDAEGFAAAGGYLTGPEPLYASPVLDVEEDQGSARSSRACQMDNPTPLFDGWVLVPREASAAMIEAAYSRPEEPWGRLYHSIYAAMLSAAPQPPESGWRTIDSAPKDGTKFLGYDTRKSPESGLRVIWWAIYFRDEEGWIDDADSEPDPTHWCPLPPPPQLPEGKV